jgi:predicted ABC-type ATPase
VTHLEFVNADVIAQQRWPDDPAAAAYQASEIAAGRRTELIARHESFVTETVFSHESKVDLVHSAVAAGYHVTLHVVLIPEALAVARVANRVENGGHAVPEDKIRGRHGRLWLLVAAAVPMVDETVVYDNSRAARPFRVVARFERGVVVGQPEWPTWTPEVLCRLGG